MNSEESKFVESVRSNSGFLAFAGVIGRLVVSGNQLAAYRMLQEIGSPPDIANEILELWVLAKDARLAPAGISTELEAAIQFALYMSDWDTMNWTALLARAVSAERRIRLQRGATCSAAQEGAPGDPEGAGE